MSSKKVNIVIGKSERESVRGGVTKRERPDLRGHCGPVHDCLLL